MKPILDQSNAHAEDALAELLDGVSKSAQRTLIGALNRMQQNPSGEVTRQALMIADLNDFRLMLYLTLLALPLLLLLRVPARPRPQAAGK